MSHSVAPTAARPIRTFVVIALAIALVAIGASTFDYMLEAMQVDLGFAIDTGNAVMLIPEIGGLALVFVAGAMGDHLGRRRMIIAGAAVFALGAALVTVAPGVGVVAAGRALEGAGSVVTAIVGLALLADTYVTPRQRSLAFGAGASIIPAVFILAPIAGAWITEHGTWRLVGALWIGAGAATAAAAWVLLPVDPARTRVELVTPLLGGAVLACIALACTMIGMGSTVPALITLGAAAVAAAVLAITMRMMDAPGLDLRIPRSLTGALTLVAIMVANAVNLLFFTTLLLQYRYGVGIVALALIMIPVQIAGVFGGLAGGALMSRVGVVPAAIGMTLLAGLVALLAIPLGEGTPVWIAVGTASLYSVFDAANSGPLTARVMNLAEPDGEGGAAAQREAWSSIGTAIGGIVAGILIFGSFHASLADNLVARGVPTATAATISEHVRDGAVVSDVAHTYDLPPRALRGVTNGERPVLTGAQFDAYAMTGVATAITYGVAAGLLGLSALTERRRRTRTG